MNADRLNVVLGREQAPKAIQLFAEISSGKYNKAELHEFNVAGLKHPVIMRAIRADMQSFVNTFIDPYLEKKSYLHDLSCVIDAGANIGYTAVLFANWWPDATIISIEPDSENFQLAKENAKHYPNIQMLHGALWHSKATLRIEAGQEDGFVVREAKNTEGIRPENMATGYSLPQLLQKYSCKSIDFLKMNIEGSEKQVFTENYSAWLPQTRAMLIELHDGKNKGCSRAVFAATGQFDFAVAETAPYGILFVKENLYRKWYAQWYKESIYVPNINKERFPEFYLDKETN